MLCQFCSPRIVTTGPSLYMFCIQTLGQHKVFSVLVLFLSFFFFPAGQPFLPSPVLKCSRAAVDILETISSLFSAFVNNPECEILPRLCLFFPPSVPPRFSDPSQFIPAGKTRRRERNRIRKWNDKIIPKCFHSFFLFFLNHYRSSTLYFSWKWAS